MEVTIQKCVEADITRVAAFYEKVILWLEDHVNYPKWVYRVYPNEDSVRALTEAGNQYICAEGDTILGAFGLDTHAQGNYQKAKWSRALDDGTFLVIHALAVDPALQKQGIGSEIIRWCLDTAKAGGYQAIRADVVPGNRPAKKLVERSGFRYAGDVDLELGIDDIPAFSLYECNL